MSDSRAKLREATNRTAKSIADLVKVVELHGHAVSTEELDKMFAYLAHTITAAEASARVARDVSRATHGSFDFDAEVPQPIRVKWQVATPRERFVKGADPNRPMAPAPPAVPDVDGVDFIDED